MPFFFGGDDGPAVDGPAGFVPEGADFLGDGLKKSATGAITLAFFAARDELKSTSVSKTIRGHYTSGSIG